MISVIMPIYNGEKYIQKSIGNILKQDFTDLELILVNDGSTDRSLDICEEYRDKDTRVKIIDKRNGGICAARNDGIRAATGDWISFADQDDNICDGIYDIFSSGVTPEVDMIVAGKRMLVIDDFDRVVSDITYDYKPFDTADKKQILKKIFNTTGDCSLMHIWNCFYRRSLLMDGGILFDERFKYGHEDTLFNSIVAIKSNCVSWVTGVVYEYYRRKKSSTSFKKNSNYIDDIRNYLDVVSENIKEEYEWDYRLESAFYTYALRLSMGMVLAYYRSIDNMSPSDQLREVFHIIKSYCKNDKVDYENTGGFLKGTYYSILTFLMKLNRFDSAVSFLKLKEIL